MQQSMPKCYTNISKDPLIITITGRISDPSPGDAYVDPETNEFFIWNGNKWILTDGYGNKMTLEEANRHELHAKFPQLKVLWEEYCIFKKLLVGDDPGE